MTCSAERGCPQSNEPFTWLVVRKLRVPGDIFQTSPLPFYIPTIPHLNTKNLPSVSGDYNHPGLLLLGGKFQTEQLGWGSLNLRALINSTSVGQLLGNVWSVARRHSPVQLGELPKQLLCPDDSQGPLKWWVMAGRTWLGSHGAPCSELMPEPIPSSPSVPQ